MPLLPPETGPGPPLPEPPVADGDPVLLPALPSVVRPIGEYEVPTAPVSEACPCPPIPVDGLEFIPPLDDMPIPPSPPEAEVVTAPLDIGAIIDAAIELTEAGGVV